jgi:hypothetical protein
MTTTASEIIPMTPMGSSMQDLVEQENGKGELELDDTATRDQARGQSLPPVDGGKAAWLFLGSCYLLEVSCRLDMRYRSNADTYLVTPIS